MIVREMVFDRPTGAALPMPSFAPDIPDGAAGPLSATGWARAYGMMLSYESAIDAAGFKTEAEMKAETSPRLVLLAMVDDLGSVTFTYAGEGRQLTAEAIRAHFETRRENDPDNTGNRDPSGPEI